MKLRSKFINGANRILTKAGLKIYSLDNPPLPDHDYVLYKYENNGKFDYQKYKDIQEKGNLSKIDLVWAREENIEFIAKYLINNLPMINLGLCHGTRRGKEQEWFSKYLRCRVIGTEISKSALDFPNTIQWDFHEAKEEWVNSVDFIYSNSFDHAYDPEKCLNAWMKSLVTGGICVIEHSDGDYPLRSSQLDPFGVDIKRLPYLIAMWSKGEYFLREILNAPFKSKGIKELYLLILQKPLSRF